MTTKNLSGTSVWRPQSRYTVSRIECRIKFPQNQRCRTKIVLHPTKSWCRTFLRTLPPRRTFLSHSQQARGRGGGGRCVAAGCWRVSRHFWVPKTDRATGRCRSYSHNSRATLCNNGPLFVLELRTFRADSFCRGADPQTLIQIAQVRCASSR